MFNRGVDQVQIDYVNHITVFKVEVKVSQNYTSGNGGKVGGDVVENKKKCRRKHFETLSM